MVLTQTRMLMSFGTCLLRPERLLVNESLFEFYQTLQLFVFCSWFQTQLKPNHARDEFTQLPWREK